MDSLYRVAVGVLYLPPLRERKGDLGLLADALLEQINRETKGPPGQEHKKFSATAKTLSTDTLGTETSRSSTPSFTVGVLAVAG